jgi:hypothetical protein
LTGELTCNIVIYKKPQNTTFATSSSTNKKLKNITQREKPNKIQYVLKRYEYFKTVVKMEEKHCLQAGKTERRHWKRQDQQPAIMNKNI